MKALAILAALSTAAAQQLPNFKEHPLVRRRRARSPTGGGMIGFRA